MASRRIKDTVEDRDRCYEATQQTVVKANELIQRAQYELSLQEQRMILYFITLIHPDDDDFKEYTVDIRDLCRICDISLHHENYRNFIESVKKLKERTIHIVDDRRHKFLSWIERVEVDEKTYTLTFRLDDRMKPFLLQLKERYTQYRLENILFFKSKYSIRLYELLSSYLAMGVCYIDVDELKQLMNVPESCDKFKMFNLRVLTPSIKEINDLSDIDVAVDFVTKGRKVTQLCFRVNRKTDEDVAAARLRRIINQQNEQAERKKKNASAKAAKAAENADLQEG